MMRYVPLDAVEFIGGPLDGLLKFVDGSIGQLEQFVATPMNHTVVQILNGRRTAIKAPAKSVAIYELRSVSRDPYYAFLGSVAPRQFEFARPFSTWLL